MLSTPRLSVSFTELVSLLSIRVERDTLLLLFDVKISVDSLLSWAAFFFFVDFERTLLLKSLLIWMHFGSFNIAAHSL